MKRTYVLWVLAAALLTTTAPWAVSRTAPAAATTPLSLTVTNTNDSGPGSLRDAIDKANAAPGSTVRFMVGSPATITLTGGELTISSDTTIIGPGAGRLSISADMSRIFHVDEGADVSISGVTLANGNALSDAGGAILNAGGLTLDRCEVEYCHAGGPGGGIFNVGKLSVRACCFANNSSSSGGGIADFGGTNELAPAIGENPPQGEGASLEIVNSSFFYNVSYAGGGAIDLHGLSCTMTNVTIYNNKCFATDPDVRGAGVWGAGGESAVLLNTIVAQNYLYYRSSIHTSDWWGAFYSEGHNLISWTDGISTVYGPGTDDLYNVDPLLDTPAFNGGGTKTAALGAGSPAIDAGDDSVSGPPLDLATDQRGPGYPRTIGAHVDIGAFESSPFESFYDDGERSGVCVNPRSGLFEWFILGGRNEGSAFMGRLNVYNGGTMFWSRPNALQYVYIYYDANSHTAWGYLYDYGRGTYSSLFDGNTLDDPDVCGFQSQRE